jgi:hypothetical protein
MSMSKKMAAIGLSAVVALCIAGPAVAKKPSKPSKVKQAVTKIDFRLDDHSVAPGEVATGTATVSSRSGKEWVALPGAVLDVTLDGVSVGTVVTDVSGVAAVVVSSADVGEHVVKVAYAGNETTKKAQRAQGFEVTTTLVVEEEEVPTGL